MSNWRPQPAAVYQIQKRSTCHSPTVRCMVNPRWTRKIPAMLRPRLGVREWKVDLSVERVFRPLTLFGYSIYRLWLTTLVDWELVVLLLHLILSSSYGSSSIWHDLARIENVYEESVLEIPTTSSRAWVGRRSYMWMNWDFMKWSIAPQFGRCTSHPMGKRAVRHKQKQATVSGANVGLNYAKN